MKKPWEGRFKEKTARVVESFTESISFDRRLWPYDIQGSIAHTRMLAKQKIISEEESEKIIGGLEEIAREIESGSLPFREELEDIHMNIESALIHKIGPIGGKLHTARSRNDQIALDLRLYLREEADEILGLIESLQKNLLNIADRHVETIMPGYTHLQRAQPVTLAHHLLAYIEMFQRDRERYGDAYKRINTLPLGACALAGTTLPIDRAYTAELLGFDRVAENSMDAVSDRDFTIEFISVSALIMMHLSRLSEELIIWSTGEFSFLEISDAYTTGSSIMPQKKNPDVAELIRGKTGRVYGALITILTVMKALPLTYNRDMQEDKIPVFDVVDTVKGSVIVMTELLSEVTFRDKRMYSTAGEGFSLATDLAEYLVGKGLPFRTAHEVIGKTVQYCIEQKKDLNDLSLNEFRRFSRHIDEDVYEHLTLETAVERRRSRGGTSPEEVRTQIARIKEILR